MINPQLHRRRNQNLTDAETPIVRGCVTEMPS
jgi:hypothetical protein